MAAPVLYTPEVLGLATALAQFRWDESLPLQAEARSASCGSTIRLGLSLSGGDVVDRIGLRSQACAIGQASAAIFAQSASGRTAQDIRTTGRAIADWLKGEGDMPDWPGLAAIAAARDYPARHGAVMLPWTAAIQLLPSGGQAR
jgi:NifU-like protein involved in Fe-S cluster formation